MAKKLQTSLEFAIMAGMVLVFFSILMLIVQGNIAKKVEERKNIEIEEIADNIQSEINLAAGARDGYYREFEVPNNIYNQDYQVMIIEEMVYVNSTKRNYGFALPIPNVTGNIINGTNIIRKLNGEILLNE